MLADPWNWNPAAKEKEQKQGKLQPAGHPLSFQPVPGAFNLAQGEQRLATRTHRPSADHVPAERAEDEELTMETKKWKKKATTTKSHRLA